MATQLKKCPGRTIQMAGEIKLSLMHVVDRGQCWTNKLPHYRNGECVLEEKYLPFPGQLFKLNGHVRT